MTYMRPQIKKLGTIDIDLVETTPVVFKERLYRFEYVRQRYKANTSGDSYFRFIDVATGNYTSAFGHSFHLGSAFEYAGRMYVFAVKKWAGQEIFMFSSDDLETWTAPRSMLLDERWEAYNTSVCRGPDRFILVYELGKPEDEVGVPFTIFFAESDDLVNWRPCEDIKPFTPERYSACPTIRFCDGHYYMTYLEGDYQRGFVQHIVRSSDLNSWEQSLLNPFLNFDNDDRKIYNNKFNSEQLEKIKAAKNINVSDVDFCEFNGETCLYYSWGDQKGVEFLAEAHSPMPLDEFLKAWFPGDKRICNHDK